jgi:hypothetical protein
MQLTVYYDGQFWVGIFEEPIDDELVVARHVFGSEPSCQEILTLVLDALPHLVDRHRALQSAPGVKAETIRVNPKRLAREAARAVSQRGVSTRSQEAIKHQVEEGKSEARITSREEREAERARRREIARNKALKRHRGH